MPWEGPVICINAINIQYVSVLTKIPVFNNNSFQPASQQFSIFYIYIKNTKSELAERNTYLGSQ
jgi:hypothetical protein